MEWNSTTQQKGSKGQLISKCLFGAFNFFQKLDEKVKFVRCFFWRNVDLKNHFDFVWRLVFSSFSKNSRCVPYYRSESWKVFSYMRMRWDFQIFIYVYVIHIMYWKYYKLLNLVLWGCTWFSVHRYVLVGALLFCQISQIKLNQNYELGTCNFERVV